MDKKRVLKIIELAATVKEFRALLKDAASEALSAAEEASQASTPFSTAQSACTSSFVKMHEQLVQMGEDVASTFAQVMDAQGSNQVGQLYRRQQGKSFWSDNQDGGLPQGDAATGNDPAVFTVEPSGKLVLARLQRSHFNSKSRHFNDTYFVFPEDIEAVS